MTPQQLIVFGILGAALVFFVWNRWRYDVVALLALLVAGLSGVVPADEIFLGFGHPAVITVAAVLVLSGGLLNAGVVDMIARILVRVGDRPILQVFALVAIVTLCSSFMNNVGALALLMPVAIWMSRKSGVSPSLLLMPLAFGSLLGGMTTLIGTPPNIIIAAYRAETAVGEPFRMFDFMPVGGTVAVVGVIFLVIVGWRLTPQRVAAASPADLFKIADYISEVIVPEDSKFAGKTLHDLIASIGKDADVNIVALVRGEEKRLVPSTFEVLRPGDVLIMESDSEGLKATLDTTGLVLESNGDKKEEVEGEQDEEKQKKDRDLGSGDVKVIEAIISADSPMVRQTATSLDLREQYGVNVLAVARQGQRLKQRLAKIRFSAGDILLLQGREDTLSASLGKLGCLRLANRGLRIGNPPKILLSLGIFIASLTVVVLGLVSAPIGLSCGAMAMILAGLISPNEAYKNIDWPVIVLLAAMIPVGRALETTGGARLVADQIMVVAQSAAPAITLGLVLAVTMALSDVINNAAAAILMAPIALGIANGLEANPDAFLMAVAIGASCAFLTPIGHQSNAMVMTPGGYRFGDYWRVGLPMSIIVVLVAVPMLMWVWGIQT